MLIQWVPLFQLFVWQSNQLMLSGKEIICIVIDRDVFPAMWVSRTCSHQCQKFLWTTSIIQLTFDYPIVLDNFLRKLSKWWLSLNLRQEESNLSNLTDRVCIHTEHCSSNMCHWTLITSVICTTTTSGFLQYMAWHYFVYQPHAGKINNQTSIGKLCWKYT